MEFAGNAAALLVLGLHEVAGELAEHFLLLPAVGDLALQRGVGAGEFIGAVADAAFHLGVGAFEGLLAAPALEREGGGEPDHGDGEDAVGHLRFLGATKRGPHEADDGEPGGGVGGIEGVLVVLRPQREQHGRDVKSRERGVAAFSKVQRGDHQQAHPSSGQLPVRHQPRRRTVGGRGADHAGGGACDGRHGT